MSGNVGLFVMEVLLGVCGFLGVWVLNRISKDINDIKISFSKLENETRGDMVDIKQRLAIIETKCSSHHHHGGQ